MNYLKEVGLLVRAFRDERGLKQLQLAELLGKTPKTMSQIENGSVATSLDTLFHIAEILDVPLWRLFKFPNDFDEKDPSRFRTVAEIAAKLSTVSDKKLDLVSKLTSVVAEHGCEADTDRADE